MKHMLYKFYADSALKSAYYLIISRDKNSSFIEDSEKKMEKNRRSVNFS